MNKLEAPAWFAKLRYRLEDFRATAIFAQGLPCSLKIRPHAGLFCRANAPRTYALIDQRTQAFLSSTIWLGDHDTGPEVLCVLSITDSQPTLRTAVAALLREMLQATSEGIAIGDPLDRQFDVLLRGFDESGTYFEYLVMSTTPGDQVVSDTTIAQTFADFGILFAESRKAAKRKPA